MSRYYSYNDFMNDVIGEADSRCVKKKGCRLHEYTKTSEVAFAGMLKLITRNWNVFAGVVNFIASNAKKVLIVVAISVFLGTPLGLVVVAILGISAATVIREMYKDKILTPAVRKTGECYKEKWKELDGDRAAIDNLMEEAVNHLLWNVGLD